MTDTSTLLPQLYSKDPNQLFRALHEIESTISTTWAEITEELPRLVEISETSDSQLQSIANFVVSKAYFYIGEYDSAVTYALRSGEYFHFTGNTDYANKMITHSIEMYITLKHTRKSIPNELESVINTFFEEGIAANELYITIGIALDAQRVDVIKRVLEVASDKESLLKYLRRIMSDLEVNNTMKGSLMEVMSDCLLSQNQVDLQSISEFWMKTNDSDGFMTMFNKLNEEMKMQVLLDYDGIPQKFRSELIKKLPAAYTPYIDGKIQEKLYLNFLFSQDKTDNLLLNNIKSATCIKNSMIQMAVLYANAFMHYGTTNIMFLKDNNEWIVNASNWAKFATTATLGVLFKGRQSEALELMSPYTANGNGGKSVYAQAGRLYALGLIFGGHGTQIMPTLIDDLKQSKNLKNEVVEHGACLGVGLAGIATEDFEIYEEMKEVLMNNDSAVAGMSAGLGLGMIMMGSGNLEVAEELVVHCRETEHDKIIRGTGVGVGLVMFGTQEKADGIIEMMLNDSNHVMRYGGVYTCALAYCGTASEKAINKLLHFAVTDRNDEVKRAAVLCLGFVLLKKVDELCKTILLLIDSYNPHVRYGAALALGIAGCGSNNSQIISLLEPLLKDPSDFVKQGACIAMGMVYLQTSLKENGKVDDFVKNLQTKINSKSEGILTQFGAIVGLGVLNAGGRNCTISMYNTLGTFNMKAVAGLVLFNQYWYWYPFTLALSLSFAPTTIIGVTPDLKYVSTYEYISNAPSSTYDYLPMTKPPVKTGHAKMNQTVLSYAKKTPQTQMNLSSSLLVSDRMKNQIVAETQMEEVKVEEKPFLKLVNGSRVTPRQFSVIQEVEGSRYVPVKKFARGVLILKDTQPTIPMDEEGIIKDQKVEEDQKGD
ncbi:26S proteasome non-ATPase regulatory subunit, putative, partial [Entamoeba invadens IP1]